MALMTCLKAVCGLGRSPRLSLVFKNSPYSVLCRGPHYGISGRTYFLKIFRKATQRDLKIKDDVPDGFVLIYRNTMSKYMQGAQIVSLIAGGLVLTAFILKSEFQTYSRNRERDFHEWSPTSRTTKNEDLYYIGFFVTFLVLMQVVISRTPIRIYKVPDTPKYIAVSYGNYFSSKYSFKRGEIFHLEEKGILPWRQHRYAIETETDRKSVILLDHYFRRPADLSIMLGEQGDPDLEK